MNSEGFLLIPATERLKSCI